MPVKTTRKQKKLRQTKLNIKPVQILVSAILVLLILSSIASWWFVSYLWSFQKSEGNMKITTLILQAIDGLSNPAPIEAQTGKVYFPQVRLVLPAATVTVGPEVEYYYSPAEIDFPEVLRIVNSSGTLSARTAMISAQNVEEAFEQVAKLQACTRGYQVSFAPLTDTEDPLIFTKQLSDGRTVSIYQDIGCKQSSQDFENYLKQIDSY